MPYLTQYRIRTLDTNGQMLYTVITDKLSLSDSGTTVIHDLIGTSRPAVRQTINSEESPFSTIRAKELQIEFYSTTDISIHTFSEGEDDRFIVIHYINDLANIIFTGFLLMDDNAQGFVTDERETVTLTATDALGTLKEVPLTDAAGNNPKGKFKLIQFLAWALSKTGLELEIHTINSLREQSSPEQSFYDSIYLDAKTFESGIGASEDCYTVINKILGWDCFLTQYKGAWYILRVDELQGSNLIKDIYFADGTYYTTVVESYYQKTIGYQQSIDFVSEATKFKIERAKKFVKLNFNFDYPEEIIDNIDFSRGGWISPLLLPDEVIDGLTMTAKAYHVDDWTLKKDFEATVVTEANAYIKRLFYGIYEKQRYLVIEKYTNGFYYLRSNRMPVTVRDRFTLGLSIAFGADLSGSGFLRTAVAQVRLYGENGTYWTLNGGYSVDPNPYWIQSNSSFTTNNRFVYDEIDKSEDLTQWRNITANAPDIPVSGEIEILLIHNNSAVNKIYYQDLRFDYEPFINGSYAKYSGLYNKISQEGNYKANVEEQVYIGDSPRKLFKGALFKYNGSVFSLAEGFYNAAVWTGGPPEPEYIKSYGNTQAFSVWNVFRYSRIVFDANLQGLTTNEAPNLPDAVHQYRFNDSNVNTNNKYFVALNFNQDLYLGEWTVLLFEIYDVNREKKYDDAYELKFLQA